MAQEIRYFELNTGAKIPSLGLGTWQSGQGIVGRAVQLAIKIGYRHIDCDRAYENEKEIHLPVRTKKESSIGIRPENLIPTDIPGTWKAMEALYDSSKARAIGVSNFSVKKLGDLLDVARVAPAVNQGFSPLGSPGTTWLKSEVLRHPILVSTAEKLGKTPAQVALGWGLQMGHSVLPKSSTESRIKENIDVFNWSIPDDLFADFSEIEQARLFTCSFVVHETLSQYKTVEELWDREI